MTAAAAMVHRSSIAFYLAFYLGHKLPAKPKFHHHVIGHGIGGEYIPIMARLAKGKTLE